MAIIVNLDVMMAKRKVSLMDLASRVGITNANLSILKTGKAKATYFLISLFNRILNYLLGVFPRSGVVSFKGSFRFNTFGLLPLVLPSMPMGIVIKYQWLEPIHTSCKSCFQSSFSSNSFQGHNFLSLI